MKVDPNAQQELPEARRVIRLPADFPLVVCLCGSTRFREEYEAAQRAETLAGRIYLSVGLMGHKEGLDMDGPIKAALDELHRRKIDLADEVLVIAPLCRVCPACKTVWRHDQIRVEVCSCRTDLSTIDPAPYVGFSTRREIEHAQALGKPIRWLHQV